jgi:hypothetical protein
METILKLCQPHKFIESDEINKDTATAHSGDSSFPMDKIIVVRLGEGLTLNDGAVFIDSSGVKLLLDTVSVVMVSLVQWFFCCTKCGKVFWEGRHFERVREQFDYVLSQDLK